MPVFESPIDSRILNIVQFDENAFFERNVSNLHLSKEAIVINNKSLVYAIPKLHTAH